MFTSKVVKGDKHGTSIGYPTANLEVDNIAKKHLKKFGIYAVKVGIDNSEFAGALFWGKRFLFDDKDPVCEVLILDFKGDLYDKEISIDVLEYLRKVVNVEDDEEFKGLIEDDIQKTKLFFDNKKI